MAEELTSLYDKVSKRCKESGQSHVLKYYEELSSEDKASLLKSIDEVPLEKLASCVAGALEEEEKLKSADPESSDIEPFAGESLSTGAEGVGAQVEEYRAKGMEAVGRGEVAAVLLAGGQGSRLGFDGPKGKYDIGLPSGRTLFQLIAERLVKLGQLCGGDVPLFVMTSPMNHETTATYFQDHDNFGLDHVSFFPQGTLPALTPEGAIILEEPAKLAKAPDGNGGIYPAMLRHGVLDAMKQRGTNYIHVFGVDNALVKPADPLFLGYCIAKAADCGNKALWKSSPEEKVGVLASRQGKPCIVEYSDISKQMTEKKGPDGRLLFGAGNICNHFYTLDFLTDTVVPNLGSMYHVARKKIPCYDDATKTTIKPSSNNGIKLESFIFDVFPLSTSMTVLDVKREEEFAPVKNPPGSKDDSPDTARQLFSNVAKKWMTEAGAILVGDVDSEKCEVTPLTSYNGEGLEEYKGKEVQCPFSV